MNGVVFENDQNREQAIREKVATWFGGLQTERKFSYTNSFNKYCSTASVEEQVLLVRFIGEEIKSVLTKFDENCTVASLQKVCNLLSGCFGTFPHAVLGVNICFNETLTFLNQCLTVCVRILNDKKHILEKKELCDLAHSGSRLLVLTIKLRRKKSNQIIVENRNEVSDWEKVVSAINEQCKISDSNSESNELLSNINQIVANMFLFQELQIDSLYNFASLSLILKEMLCPPGELSLFVTEISEELAQETSKTARSISLLRLLLCNASLNTWTVDVMGVDWVPVCLNFLLILSDKYSSDTPIVLNSCRTLYTLVKHDSFKLYLNTIQEFQVERLLSSAWMLLEHPVSCVRNSARDLLQTIVTHSQLQNKIMTLLFTIPRHKRSFFIVVALLVSQVGCEKLIQHKSELPSMLLEAVYDPTIVSHVSVAVEAIVLNHEIADMDIDSWCEVWIFPLLQIFNNTSGVVAADLEKLLHKIIRERQLVMDCVLKKWQSTRNENELRALLTCLKISCKVIRNSGTDSDGTMWRNLIPVSLLRSCLYHVDNEIRLSAFSLLIENYKSTQQFNQIDFDLIKCFFKYNLICDKPDVRQRIVGLVKKMLQRWVCGLSVIQRKPDNTQVEQSYYEFYTWLIDHCYTNIFTGANMCRMSTVLSILEACYELNVSSKVQHHCFKQLYNVKYWDKIIVCLCNSYEDNKIIGYKLAAGFDPHELEFDDPAKLEPLLETALKLSSSIEPPDITTAGYMFKTLTLFSSTTQLLKQRMIRPCQQDDVKLVTVRFLLSKLESEVNVARYSVQLACTRAPMYGLLFAIRLILHQVDFKTMNAGLDGDKSSEVIHEWKRGLREVFDISVTMCELVCFVLKHSSPEGYLPLKSHDEKDDSSELSMLTSTYKAHMCLRKFFAEEMMLKATYFKYSIHDVQTIKDMIEDVGSVSDEDTQIVREMMVELEKDAEHISCDYNAYSIYPTAQILLLCAWRTVKECSLYFGDLVSRVPIGANGLINSDIVYTLGDTLTSMLCEIKHRGAFEHAYLGFTQLCTTLWNSHHDLTIHQLPMLWLDRILTEITRNNSQLCSTRRSAGVPFLIQAIVSTELQTTQSTVIDTMKKSMEMLLDIAESPDADRTESRIHSLNIVRALVKHYLLGELISPYISKALRVCIVCSRGATWSERNSSNLLFSSLITRIFGVSRSRDDLSRKNTMTASTFFQRYSELYEFLLNELELAVNNAQVLEPSLYQVLLVLGRIYPSSTREMDMTPFIKLVDKCRSNKTMKIRELSARALVSLITPDVYLNQLQTRLKQLLQDRYLENEIHGLLLQLIYLVKYCPEEKLTDLDQILSTLSDYNFSHNYNSVKKCYLLSSLHFKLLFVWFKRTKMSSTKYQSLESWLQSDQVKTCKEPTINIGINDLVETKTVLQLELVLYTMLEEEGEMGLDVLYKLLTDGCRDSLRVCLKALLCWFNVESEFLDENMDPLCYMYGDAISYPSHYDSLQITLVKERIVSDRRIWNYLTELMLNDTTDDVLRRMVNLLLYQAKVVDVNIDCVDNTEEYTWLLYRSLRSQPDHVSWRNYMQQLVVNSSHCMDVRNRLSSACSIKNVWECLLKECSSVLGDVYIWTVMIKLTLDNDPKVRLATVCVTQQLVDYVNSNTSVWNILVPVEVDVNVTTEKSLQLIVDCMFNIIYNQHSLIKLVIVVVYFGLSSWTLREYDDSEQKSAVFERGSPNDYMEDILLTDVLLNRLRMLNMSDVVQCLHKQVSDEERSLFTTDSVLQLNTLQDILQLLSTRFYKLEQVSHKPYLSIHLIQMKKIFEVFSQSLPS